MLLWLRTEKNAAAVHEPPAECREEGSEGRMWRVVAGIRGGGAWEAIGEEEMRHDLERGRGDIFSVPFDLGFHHWGDQRLKQATQQTSVPSRLKSGARPQVAPHVHTLSSEPRSDKSFDHIQRW